MADELTIRASLSFEKNDTLVELLLGPKKRDVAGTHGKRERQNIGTVEEAVAMGDVAAGGYVLVVNRDPTNYVQLRSGTGLQAFARLLPGDFCLFRLDNGATLYAIANTAACDIEFAAVDL
jgi:hypothetical protein